MPRPLDRYEDLKRILSQMGSAVVAFSGGVDSTFLLKVAGDVLKGRVAAVTARSCSFPARELDAAAEFCRSEGIRHEIMDSEELSIPGFCENPPDRCYLCKRELFGKITAFARANGYDSVLEGSNADDDGDYRPGRRAIREFGVKSPLHDAGLTKSDIRELSRGMGLPTWRKQSFACLASRFPYGERITAEKLSRVDRAEQFLLDSGADFSQVRVRSHGDLARIEIPPESFGRALAMRQEIVSAFKGFGFRFVSLDLAGYRTGSMNATLPDEASSAKEVRA